MTLFSRSSGILLHPTSLPGRHGIGDLGEWAFKFIDYLVEHQQSVWQILPLGQTSYGDSPYQALSSFAGNTNLISFDKLLDAGWLQAEDLADLPEFPVNHVDYGWIYHYRGPKLALAYERFSSAGSAADKRAFADFCAEQADWLDDYALFIALKEANGGKQWTQWENKGEALRDAAAITVARSAHASAIDRQKFYQWVFYTQWMAVKTYANDRGVRIIGDIPIFVAHDSSDVWVNRDLFYLYEDGEPEFIAGVPPDYFSPTGQRWGNPLYRWDAHKAQGYHWWISRLKAILSMVDIVRIDHFRGFIGYWEVPASEATAVKGRWMPGPGFDLFEAIRGALGTDLPIIAEDLGVITPEVEALRDGMGLPGMKVIQFAFGTENCGDDPFLPHHYTPNCVAYTGTHDNNTAVGWWQGEAKEHERECFKQYIGGDVYQPNWEMIRLGMGSVAHTFVMPFQDVLGLGAGTRMNTPGKESGNWGWRFTPEALNHPARNTLAHLTRLYSRTPKASKSDA